MPNSHRHRSEGGELQGCSENTREGQQYGVAILIPWTRSVFEMDLEETKWDRSCVVGETGSEDKSQKEHWWV